MPRSVAVVFDPDFSSALEKLAFHTPVWMVDTPENRAAAEEAWRNAIEWPHISVTLFRDYDWPTLLYQIALNEKFDALEVLGSPLSAEARTALEAAGFVRIHETENGFRARR
ncbi:MAG TPA: hypothetical protein VF266_01020 [Thermoanaerobaculia bacterium]